MDLGERGRYWQVACPHFVEPSKSTETQVVVFGGAVQIGEVVQFNAVRDLLILSFGIDQFSVDIS